MLRTELLSLLLLGSSSLAPHALAQSIVDFSQLPACAATCYSLNTAQSLCVPPTAPSASQTTYDTCFCNSNFLTQFSSDAAAICDPPCTQASDRTAIQTWFVNFCKNIGVNAATTATVATTAATTAATSTGASSTDGATDPSNVPTNVPNQTWWDIHARWIAMAIVLIVGFSIVTIVGVIWKRRYDRKRNTAGAAPNGGAWGPNLNQHFDDSRERFPYDQEKGPNATAQGTSASSFTKKGSKVKKFMGR